MAVASRWCRLQTSLDRPRCVAAAGRGHHKLQRPALPLLSWYPVTNVTRLLGITPSSRAFSAINWFSASHSSPTPQPPWVRGAVPAVCALRPRGAQGQAEDACAVPAVHDHVAEVLEVLPEAQPLL